MIQASGRDSKHSLGGGTYRGGLGLFRTVRPDTGKRTLVARCCCLHNQYHGYKQCQRGKSKCSLTLRAQRIWNIGLCWARPELRMLHSIMRSAHDGLVACSRVAYVHAADPCTGTNPGEGASRACRIRDMEASKPRNVAIGSWSGGFTYCHGFPGPLMILRTSWFVKNCLMTEGWGRLRVDTRGHWLAIRKAK